MGFSEVKERREVGGFTAAVAVGPWLAGEQVGTKRRREIGEEK